MTMMTDQKRIASEYYNMNLSSNKKQSSRSRKKYTTNPVLKENSNEGCYTSNHMQEMVKGAHNHAQTQRNSIRIPNLKQVAPTAATNSTTGTALSYRSRIYEKRLPAVLVSSGRSAESSNKKMTISPFREVSNGATGRSPHGKLRQSIG